MPAFNLGFNGTAFMAIPDHMLVQPIEQTMLTKYGGVGGTRMIFLAPIIDECFRA